MGKVPRITLHRPPSFWLAFLQEVKYQRVRVSVLNSSFYHEESDGRTRLRLKRSVTRDHMGQYGSGRKETGGVSG